MKLAGYERQLHRGMFDFDAGCERDAQMLNAKFGLVVCLGCLPFHLPDASGLWLVHQKCWCLGSGWLSCTSDLRAGTFWNS